MYNHLLPVPDWARNEIQIHIQKKGTNGQRLFKDVKMWKRDPMKVIQELIENPDFKDDIHYKPTKLYMDEDWCERIYNEMWMGELWNETAVRDNTQMINLKNTQ